MPVKGFDEFQRNLRELSQRAQALDGTHEIPIHDLLTPDFIRTHTRHGSVDEWLNASPFRIDTTEDLQAVPAEKWGDYVRTTTGFASWQDMLESAAAQYVQAKLFG
jgi:hypothetical protein